MAALSLLRASRRGLILAAGGTLLAGLPGGQAGAAGRMGRLSESGPKPLPEFSFTDADGKPYGVADFAGKGLVINLWATWCPPCVAEMPALDRFHREFSPRGWQVVGLAIDGPTPVREFLAKTPVGFPIGLAGLTGTELVRALGNAQGGLPFTVVIDASGRIVQQKLGETSFDELAGWAAAMA